MANASQEEFMVYVKRILLLQLEKVEEAWRKLEEMEQDERFAECCSMNNLRIVLNNTLPIRNIRELPKLLVWFSKFPETATASNPISDDIATCIKNNIEQLKNNPCFPEIVEVIKENHTIYLPKTSNHTNFCKAVVELLSWLPEEFNRRDLENIKECLMYICENDYSGENMSVVCFSAMCENLVKTTRNELPSSALIIVFQLVDNQLWKENMSIAVSKIINIAEETKVIDMLSYFCSWLANASYTNNMTYLSGWLTLFMISLESMDSIDFNKRKRIPMRVADNVLPQLFENCLRVNDFFDIEPEQNIILLLITKVGSLSLFHEIIENVQFALKTVTMKKQFLEALMQCIHMLTSRFEHVIFPCPNCAPIKFLWSYYLDDVKKEQLTFLPKPINSDYGSSFRENVKKEQLSFLSKPINSDYGSSFRGRRGVRDINKCGLVNLGNTCYMNSVLQALFMTQQFCREVLIYKTTNDLSDQTTLKHLQNLFALLKYSSKTSLAANQILHNLRPAYFTPGQQQDSSEFLCYLLDVLYEQEKSSILQNSSTESNQCNKSTVKEEAMDTEDGTTESSSNLNEEGSTGNMTRWITEENLSEAEGSSLERKTQSLADFTQGEEMSQTQNGLSDSHSDSTDSGIQSVGGEDSTSSTTSSSSSPMVSASSAYLVQKVFGGELKITYQCLECHNESHNTDQFRDLQLCFLENLEPHMEVKVQELINANYLMPEKLTDDNKYRCDNCAGLKDAQRSIKILQAPAHLILTLKHFRYDNQSLLRTKLRRKVIYDDTISLPVLDQENETYDLYAAVVHFGDSMDYGHYVAYACDAKKQWYRFNDSLVTQTTLEEFKDLEAPDTPYILFYKKRTETQEPDIPELSLLSRSIQDYVEQDKFSDRQRVTRRSQASSSSIVPYYPPGDDDDDNPAPSSSSLLQNAPIVRP